MNRKTVPICNEDCFHCPYDDCIRDDLTAKTYRDLSTIDKEIVNPKTLKQQHIAAKNREYYETNREAYNAYHRAYYKKRKEQHHENRNEAEERNQDLLPF